ncbi:MAG: tetratricopeptide repeat protein [Gammaproteobacteria bacterium]|nr:tetratricopeptide repeat protein [Gammaproteobacteria bacterium]
MAINAAEEESLDALKKWWDENGKQLLLLVVVAIAGYSGWLLWQNSQLASAEAASDLYEEILTLAVNEPGIAVTELERSTILGLSEQLRSDYPDSVYALYGALFAAQQLVASNDLDGAEQSLQWILDNQPDGLFQQADEGLVLATNLRMGRVILAKGDPERALTLVNAINPSTFEAGFAELRGDIYIAMGRIVDARNAYIAAQQAGSNSDGLRMKLDDLPDSI